MKKVLWVSRHTMTDTQFADLERIMGGEIQIEQWDKTVESVAEIATAMEEADVVAVVLPLHMMPPMLKAAGDKPVLQAVAERKMTGKMHILEDGREEQEVQFVHKHWEQILKVEVCKKILA